MPTAAVRQHRKAPIQLAQYQSAVLAAKKPDPLSLLADDPEPAGLLVPAVPTAGNSSTPDQQGGDSGPYDASRLRPELLPASAQDFSRSSELEFGISEQGLTLAALEQMAAQYNPTIAQASAGVGKALGIHEQVGFKPNPSIGYFGEEIGNDDSAGLQGIFVSQTIVRGNKLQLNREVVSHDVRWARLQYDAQTFRVRNDIRVQFFKTLATQKRLELAREFSKVAQQGVTISKELVAAKEAARPDVLQSEIQLSEAQLAIRQTEIELQAAWNELVSITGICDLPQTRLIGDLAAPKRTREFESTFAEISAQSPLLAAACARVARAHANIRRQKAQTFPNLNAQLGAGHDNGTGDEFANVQLSMPIPIHNANEGNIRAAQAEYCEAIQNERRIQLQIRRELARAMQEYEVAKATVEQYESTVIPKAKESLELLLLAQESGEFDFLRVFTARRTFFDVNQRYVIALSQLAQADTRIEGLLLSGGLSKMVNYDASDELRGQALSGQ